MLGHCYAEKRKVLTEANVRHEIQIAVVSSCNNPSTSSAFVFVHVKKKSPCGFESWALWRVETILMEISVLCISMIFAYLY